MKRAVSAAIFTVLILAGCNGSQGEQEVSNPTATPAATTLPATPTPSPVVQAECPKPTACPGPTACPPAPTCPEPVTCPTCPEPITCPTCPGAIVCPDCPTCAEPVTCPSPVVCPGSTPCPACPMPSLAVCGLLYPCSDCPDIDEVCGDIRSLGYAYELLDDQYSFPLLPVTEEVQDLHSWAVSNCH
jgi:hypothetical protein